MFLEKKKSDFEGIKFLKESKIKFKRRHNFSRFKKLDLKDDQEVGSYKKILKDIKKEKLEVPA